MLCASIALAACDDGESPAAGTPSPGATVPAITATATPAATLGEQIGVRGDIPDADPIDLAFRYGLTDTRAGESKPFEGEKNIGDTREFFVTRITGAAIAQTAPPEIATITATVRAKTEHAYIYIDNALEADPADIEAAAASFEALVWPTVTGVFGFPPTPGVDGDPRVIVLQADLGGAVGGYVSGDDGYLRAVRPFSNEAEMFYMDRTLRIGGGGFDVVAAHELQHLIHVANDSGEEAWANEGLSETAAQLAGGAVSSIGAFEANPSTQLNSWSSQGSGPHYGAGAAFFRYLADRCGGDAVLGLVAQEQADGAAGVEAAVSTCGGDAGLSFTALYVDWMTANLLNSDSDPRFANPTRDIEPRIEFTLSPGDTVEGTATQFGADYYQAESLGDGEHVLRFNGADTVDVLPIPAAPGGGMWWSNEGDEINPTLTYDLDLNGVANPELTFRLWHDIERWYDWAYVAISVDSGTSWTALTGDHTTGDDPIAMAFGVGYTGMSGDGDAAQWVDERISLGAYAGQRVQLRLEYVTDGATYGEGLAFDAIAVSGVATMPEPVSRGWVNIDTALPQTYCVRLVAEDAAGAPVVRELTLDANGDGELPFDATGLRNVVFAVAGTTEGTRQKAPYTIELDRP